MLSDRTLSIVFVILVSFPLLIGQGCPPTTVGGGDPVNDLTPAEQQAILNATTGAETLGQTTHLTKAAVDDEESSGQAAPSTCPTVSKTGSILTGPVSVTLDWGDGCTMYWLNEGQYACSGSATGTLNAPSKTISLEFDSTTCNGETVDGSVALSWSFDIDASAINSGTEAVGDVELTGDWDMTASKGGNTVRTYGAGTCGYNNQAETTRVPEFSGTVSDELSICSLVIDDLLVSYLTYYSYIPYSGTITISGTDIRTLTVSFDENSPTAGTVKVSIGAGPTFSVNLDDLAALIAAAESAG